MTKEDLRIVYMGTPDFAVESLRALVEGGYHVVAVVTMPDKPVGRHGSVLQPSPVKQYAVEHGLKVMQPEKLKDPAFVEELRSLKADLQIVVAFRMLPEIVWSMPPLGTFNLHASLLPKYRGAAPHKETVTIAYRQILLCLIYHPSDKLKTLLLRNLLLFHFFLLYCDTLIAYIKRDVPG